MRFFDFDFTEIRLLLVLYQILEILQRTDAKQEWKEYCPHEFFNVTCGSRGVGESESETEVILMEGAQYGRMRAGRCVSTNVGCSIDVLEFLDRKCSGRRQCAVYVSDPTLQRLAPCSKEFTSYIEAKYSCLPVSGVSMSRCLTDRQMTMSGKAIGYIASISHTEHSGYGTGNCPWKIEAEPGQTIRLSLLSFGTRGLSDSVTNTGGGRSPSDIVGPDACYEIVEVQESLTKSSTTRAAAAAAAAASGPSDRPTVFSMCSENSRENVFFVSTGNVVTVQLKPPEVLKGLSPFIIKYEVLGCRPVTAPTGGHAKIDGNTATVRCNESKETWFLTCTGNTWLGHIGNCSDKASSLTTNNGDVASLVEDNFPYGILLVVAIGVALGVLIGGVLLSCVAYYMKRQTRLHGYAEPSEWTKQMLDEMEAYNEAKQFANTRYIQDVQNAAAAAAAAAAVGTAVVPGAPAASTSTPNRTVTMDRPGDFNVVTGGHVRGCTCPRDDNDYPVTTTTTSPTDCRLILTSGTESNQSRFLYEIPQFNN